MQLRRVLDYPLSHYQFLRTCFRFKKMNRSFFEWQVTYRSREGCQQSVTEETKSRATSNHLGWAERINTKIRDTQAYIEQFLTISTRNKYTCIDSMILRVSLGLLSYWWERWPALTAPYMRPWSQNSCSSCSSLATQRSSPASKGSGRAGCKYIDMYHAHTIPGRWLYYSSEQKFAVWNWESSRADRHCHCHW